MSKKSVKKKISVDPTGKSWEEIIELDPVHIRGISKESFAVAVSRLVSAYNKRAKRLEKSGMAQFSPAYKGIEKAGKTRLSVKGKTFNELMTVYADAKRFLTEKKTSSVKGTRKLKRDTERRIGHQFTSKEESNRYWEAIDKLKEKNIGNGDADGRTSTDVQREVSDMMFNEGASVDEILEHYGIQIMASTPNIQEETETIYGFGEVNQNEVGEDNQNEVGEEYEMPF